MDKDIARIRDVEALRAPEDIILYDVNRGLDTPAGLAGDERSCGFECKNRTTM